MRGSTKAATRMRMALPSTLSLASLLFVQSAWPGNISVAPPKVESNRYIVPVALDDATTGVTSMDFQLRYDPTVFTPVEVVAGSSASFAGKVVDGNLTAPGTYTVLVMGLNQNGLPPGEVAQVVFERNPDAVASSSLLAVARTTLSDAEGNVLPSSGGERLVDLDAQPQEPPQPEKPEKPEPEVEAPESESPAVPPATPEEKPTGDTLNPEIGPSVADALLSGLSRGAKSKEKAPEEADDVPLRTTPGVTTETGLVDTPAAPAEASPELARAVPAGDENSDSTRLTRTQVTQAMPGAETTGAAATPEDSAGTPAVTVEKPNDVLAPDGGADNAQEGDRKQPTPRWRAVLPAAALMGILLLVVWWRRKPAAS